MTHPSCIMYDPSVASPVQRMRGIPHRPAAFPVGRCFARVVCMEGRAQKYHGRPSMEDLLAAVSRPPKPVEAEDVRALDVAFIQMHGKQRLDLKTLTGAIGSLVVWNVILTIACSFLIWLAFTQ